MITPAGLYVDDQGRRITTHSMIKTFARCPNQARYKYQERLKKRFITRRDQPLKRGTWFHTLLEEYYARRSWIKAHQALCANYTQLFDEEKEALGDLPTEMLTLMRAYLWHYGADKSDPYHGWDVKGTELTMECPWPDSTGDDLYRCRLDIMFQDELGLWVGDHKTNKSLPDMTFRLLDYASALYIWCARENGYPIRGFVWNYIKAKSPTVPHLAYAGTDREAMSRAAIETDFPTMLRFLREHDLPLAGYKDKLRYLKSQRWERDKVQNSPFFRRDVMEKDDALIIRVVGAAMKTRDRMHEYDWSLPERTVDRSCTFSCSFTDLCTTELFGGNAGVIRRTQFRTGDPLEYYQDTKEIEG